MEKNIPYDIKSSLDRYVNDGIETGSFLRAVLENNLIDSVGKADYQNSKILPEICSYVYNYLPSNCWGSKEKVNKWLKRKREERETN